MSSDPTRLRETWAHIERIRRALFPHLVAEGGLCRVAEVPWCHLPAPKQFAILTASVRWDGITGPDQANILLSQIDDPEKLTEAQRLRLVSMALPGRQAARRREMEMER